VQRWHCRHHHTKVLLIDCAPRAISLSHRRQKREEEVGVAAEDLVDEDVDGVAVATEVRV